MCVAKSDVCFTPNSDRESGHRQTVRSALPPKADMCGATAATARLVHDDARPDFAIQQPLEVEAGKLIIRSFTNMRGEGGDGAGIARFQFGKCLEITLCRSVFVLFRPQRLEGANGFRAAPQQKVPHRTAPEVIHLCREDRADTNAGAESFVGRFQPRCDVDGIAIGRVVEEVAATEIADNRRSCMSTDTCDSQRDALFLPALAE